MQINSRSYLTAGIAALGVSTIVLSPVQPVSHQLAPAATPVINHLAVELAATVNPLQAVADAFTTTVNNGLTLAEYFLQNPFPLLTTVASNQVTYLQELFSGKGNLIWPQITNNIKTLFEAPLDPGPTSTLVNDNYTPPTEATIPIANPFNGGGNLSGACTQPGLDNCLSPQDVNLLALQVIGGASVDDPSPVWDAIVQFAPVLRFTQSFASGVLIGAVGPLLSPLVSLSRSVNSFVANLQAGQYLDAVYELVNIPTNMTNAFFNGAGFWDLTKVIENFTGFSLEGVGKVGLNLGGLLNVAPLTTPPTDQFTPGTAFDSLVVGGDPGQFFGNQPAPGVPVGLGGSMVGMGQYLGDKLRLNPPPTPAAAAPAAAAAEAPAAADTPAVQAPAVVDAPAVEVPKAVLADSPAVDLPAALDAAAVDAVPAATAPSGYRGARAAAATAGSGAAERAEGHAGGARGNR
jgi:hypothetical protein